jgi:CheY-like chemotaxis protein
VLLDLNMPRMNGREFLRILRADPRVASIPVYIITTSTRKEDILACRESGFSGHVLKSTELELFSDNMTAVLLEACEGLTV